MRFGFSQRIHCVPFDAAVGMTWSALLATLRAAGRAMPIKDSLIAATALTHDLAVVTRNRSDFEKTGVRIIDPFASGREGLGSSSEVEGFRVEVRLWSLVNGSQFWSTYIPQPV